MQTTGNLGLKKPEGTDIVDIADLNGNMDILDTTVNNKVDKVTGKQLSTNDYTASEKTKLAGIATGATNYTHPATHPPSIIAQDASNRFVTDAEKAAWNGKAPNTLVSAAPQSDGLMRATDKIKLDGIATGANNYVHPANHPATMITEDATHRFATDTEKSNWNGKPNLDTTPQQTTADLTYYVRTDGNDSNVGTANTAAGAFKTIGKAISMIPQTINHNVTINVAAGTYPEAVLIGGTSGKGYVNFVGTSAVVQSFKVTRCHRIVVSGFTATNVNDVGFYAADGGTVDFSGCIVATATSTTYGVAIFNQMAAIKNCTLSNRSLAIYVSNALVTSSNNGGSGNGQGLYAAGSSTLYKTGTQPTSVIAENVENGGIILGSAGVLNPWGDNTSDKRSAFAAGAGGTAQVIATSTLTKVAFNSRYFDHLTEWDVVNNRFFAKEKGIYNVNVYLTYLAGASVMDGAVVVFKNGPIDQYIGMANGPASKDLMVSGNISTDLNAGDRLEIYTSQYTGGSLTISNNGGLTHIRITRLA
jgi:hypothetical protein